MKKSTFRHCLGRRLRFSNDRSTQADAVHSRIRRADCSRRACCGAVCSSSEPALVREVCCRRRQKIKEREGCNVYRLMGDRVNKNRIIQGRTDRDGDRHKSIVAAGVDIVCQRGLPGSQGRHELVASRAGASAGYGNVCDADPSRHTPCRYFYSCKYQYKQLLNKRKSNTDDCANHVDCSNGNSFFLATEGSVMACSCCNQSVDCGSCNGVSGGCQGSDCYSNSGREIWCGSNIIRDLVQQCVLGTGFSSCNTMLQYLPQELRNKYATCYCMSAQSRCDTGSYPCCRVFWERGFSEYAVYAWLKDKCVWQKIHTEITQVADSGCARQQPNCDCPPPPVCTPPSCPDTASGLNDQSIGKSCQCNNPFP
jgi:hypothetical protein